MIQEEQLKVLMFDIMERQDFIKAQYEYLEKQKQEAYKQLEEIRKANKPAELPVVPPAEEIPQE